MLQHLSITLLSLSNGAVRLFPKIFQLKKNRTSVYTTQRDRDQHASCIRSLAVSYPVTNNQYDTFFRSYLWI